MGRPVLVRGLQLSSKFVQQLGGSKKRVLTNPKKLSASCPGVRYMSFEPQLAKGYPAIDIPDNVSLAHHLLQAFPKYSNLVALVNGVTGQTTTYGELLTQITRVSSALVKLGLQKGDVVNIFSPNCPEFAVLYLAVMAAGGIVSSVNPLYTSSELAYALGHADVKFIATIPQLLPVVKEAMKNAPATKEIIIFGEGDKCHPLAALLEDDGTAFPENLEFNPQKDIAALPYSSGTTGLPKGVMLSHYNLVSNVEQICAKPVLEYSSGEHTLIGVLPFFHIYGQMVVMLSGLFCGAKIVTMPKFDPELYLNLIQSHKITHLLVVPPILLFMAKHPMVDNYDLASAFMGIIGAAPVSPDVVQSFIKRINRPDFMFRQGFGMTELSPLTHLCPQKNIKFDTIGYMLPNIKQKIVDVQTGQSLGIGQEGELCVQGPNVMMGYLKNPEATQNTIKDGWLHTGDIGYVDEDGHTKITDRLKELIKYKGLQVAPAELERLLVTHPAVVAAAVIGFPDERAGELPRAYVVLKPDVKVAEEEIQNFIKGKVAPYKELSGGVVFRESIPVSPSGKILRWKLKEEFKNK